MDTLNRSLNKGIPNDIDIDLPFSDLLNLCSNKNKTLKFLEETILNYFDRLSTITKKKL